MDPSPVQCHGNPSWWPEDTMGEGDVKEKSRRGRQLAAGRLQLAESKSRETERRADEQIRGQRAAVWSSSQRIERSTRGAKSKAQSGKRRGQRAGCSGHTETGRHGDKMTWRLGQAAREPFEALSLGWQSWSRSS
jgi:hypothetical protein